MNGQEFTESNLRVIRYGKSIICSLLIFGVLIVLITNLNEEYFGIPSWYVVLPVSVVLIVENVLKIYLARSFPAKIPCYVIDSVLLLILTMFTTGTLISTLYIVILSEFYLGQKKLVNSIAMGVASLGLFLITFAVSYAVRGQDVVIGALISSAVNDIVLMVFHFLIFNFSLQIYRKNREITTAFAELNESNEKLRVAYEELKEITALEERQRIAKDIHDTAGHSITTVIMQTEAAKLVLESDPQEAKRRISAANLQAKNVLEELRESVHLLSGNAEENSLKEMLLAVIHDSTDGTEITIRYEIEEISLCDAKRRFLINSLKEGISNGLRHGGATAFWFELKEEKGKVYFLLSDNGAGMDIEEFKEGFGLSGMEKRAEALGGNVWFETEKEEGFEIHATLPMDENNP